MKKALRFSVSLVFLNQFIFSQIGKDGLLSTTSNTIVNQYYSVISNINAGNNFAVVNPSPVLNAGDLVLVIQMQGASVNCYTNPSNTLASLPNTNYGAITNYNNAGNYEFNEVSSVSGNTVYVTCPFQKNYTASGKVQLIRVPRFSNLIVNNPHTIYGTPWNGTTGGVIAVEVSSSLTINSGGKISADTIGFRGGITNLRNSSPAYGVGDFGHLDKSMGVYKGEGIAGDTLVYATLFSGRFGKGAVANGGGGGNAVNAGGGGGANAGDTALWNGKGNPDVSTASWITAWNLESPGFASNTSSGGGRGGYCYSNSNKDPLVYGPNDYTNWGGDGRSNNGGLGGRPLDYASGRVFLGGGGGAGDADNGYAGKGGSGGGIIFILNYGVINGSGVITANGRNGYNTSTPSPSVNDLTGRDGAGGGGGGGAVIIKTPVVAGSLTVTAKGGNGGNQQMRSGYIFGSPNDAYGPGGGGGGGYIGSSVTLPFTDVSGGNNGIVQYLSGSNGCLIDNNFPPNGATKGGAGIVTNTLTPPESISVSPAFTVSCVNTVFSATATSTGTGIINWYSSYSSTTSVATGSVFSTSISSPGTYTFYAGTCPGIMKSAFIVSVTPNPTVSVNSATICSGQTATLTASGASSYTWNTGATLSSITVSPVSNSTYTVVGTNGNCSDTKTTQVIVNPSPTISVNNATICSGQSTTLTVSGASSYTWNTGANTNSIIVSPVSNTTYTVSGDNGTCINTQTAQVVVNTNPTISVNSATICNGQTTILIANGASSYTWNTGANTNTILVSPVSNTTYTVVGANGNCSDTKTAQVIVNPNPTVSVTNATVCSGQGATLTASGVSSYTWSTGANTNTISVSPVSSTSYTVVGGNGNGCTDTQTAQVVVNPSPTISVNSATICNGQTITLTANGASSYTWNTGANTNTISVSPVSNTTYTVIGANGNCIDTQTAQVVVNPNPTITVNSATICSGQSATLTASGASSYTWNTGSSSSSIIVSPSSNTIYTVTGISNGCTDTQTTSVVVNTTPPLTITPSSTVVCKDNCLTINYSPNTYTNVQFDFGAGYTSLNTNCYNNIGIYNISAYGTYSNGCTYTTTPITINVISNPIADFNMPTQGFTNESISITNLSNGAQLYVWNFGDGNVLNTFSYNISHTFNSSGTYCVFLTAIDTAFLCNDTVTKCIVIQDNFEIEIPNVFTPNADGTNDVFKVRAKGVKSIEGKIFDRWGLLLFEWNDLNTGWNGYLKNNTKAPTGTYYYLIKCVLINDEVKEYKGYLTLLE